MILFLLEKYFFWFMIYSMCGWIYETILCSVLQKKFVNRGFLNGPYCPIYGCGAVLDILVLGRIENPLLLFFLGVFFTCGLEYLTSFLMEKLFHARWWDYSDQKFNLNGRICLTGALVFGAFSVVLILFLQPFVSSCTDLIPLFAFHIITVAFVLFFLLDIFVTLIGFTGFNEKLKECALYLEKTTEHAISKLHATPVFAVAESVYENLASKLTHQQERMLRAFPKLKSVSYNDILSELRVLLRKKRKGESDIENSHSKL